MTATNVQTLRNKYSALMHACLQGSSDTSADFNRRVKGLIHELADGEQPNYSPAQYYRAACEVAYHVYRVDYRTV